MNLSLQRGYWHKPLPYPYFFGMPTDADDDCLRYSIPGIRVFTFSTRRISAQTIHPILSESAVDLTGDLQEILKDS